MRGLALFSALMICSLSAAAQTPDLCIGERSALHADALTPAEIERTIAADMRAEMQRAGIPGGALIVVREGAVLYSAGFGKSNVAQGRPFDPISTVFPIGSISKTMTALTVLNAARSGRLDLDAPLSADPALRDFKGPRGEAITLRHLLTHTAGFEEAGPNFYDARPFAARPPIAAHLQRTRPAIIFTPGSRRAYSNYGFAVAAYRASEASGRHYEDLLQLAIFAPLKMSETTAAQPFPAGFATRLATGYAAGDGPLRAVSAEFSRAPGAGEVVTTGADMARFMTGLLDPTKTRGLDAAVVATAMTAHFQETPCGPALGYPFWIERRHGASLVKHSGETFGFVADMLLFPEHRLGAFFVFNKSEFAALSRIEDRIVDTWFGAPPPAPRLSGAPAPSGLFLGSRTSETNVGHVARLLGDGVVDLRASTTGDLTYRGEMWRRVRDDLWIADTGGKHLAAFTLDGKTAFVQSGAQSFVAASSLENPSIALAVLAASFIALIAGGLTLLIRRPRIAGGDMNALAISAPALAAAVTTLGLGLFFAAGVDQESWAYGAPLLARIGLALTLALPVLCVVSVLAAARLLGSSAGLVTKALYLASTTALVALTAVLANTRLIGWSF